VRYVSAVEGGQRQLLLGLWGGEAGSGQDFFVERDEETFAAGEDRSVEALKFGLVKELAVGCSVGPGSTAEMSSDEDERLVERGGAEVVDLHVTGHSENVEGAVEFAHRFVEECGDDAAVDVAGRTLVHAVELDLRCCGDGVGVRGVSGEGEMKTLGIGWAAAEAMIGALIDGGCVHRGRSMAGRVGCGHSFWFAR
jgi:hypothetical protein